MLSVQKHLRLSHVDQRDASGKSVRLPKPMHGCPASLSSSIRSFPNVHETAKKLHRPLTESAELDDIFTWREPRRITNSLPITYDKFVCILMNTK